MFPFKIGKKEVKKVYIPVDIVLRYSEQGMSEPEIIARLEEQGFPSEHIDRALRVALREKVVSGAPPTVETREAPEAPSPTPFGVRDNTVTGPVPMGEVTRRPMPMGYPPERIVQAPPQTPVDQVMQQLQPTYQAPPQEYQSQSTEPTTEITVEEIIEAIISERWKDFEERLNTFEKKDMQLQGQIQELSKRIEGFASVLNDKEKTIVTKLDEFGESVDTIEGRIGSIERVFKDFLPELTTNIKTMSSLVQTIKKEKESY